MENRKSKEKNECAQQYVNEIQSQDGLAGSLGRGENSVKGGLLEDCAICTTRQTREFHGRNRREERKYNAETQSPRRSAEKN